MQLRSLIIVGLRCSNMYLNNSTTFSWRTNCYLIYAERPDVEILADYILEFYISILSNVMYVSHAGEFMAIITFSLPQNRLEIIYKMVSLFW